jgi:hypothetical protein
MICFGWLVHSSEVTLRLHYLSVNYNPILGRRKQEEDQQEVVGSLNLLTNMFAYQYGRTMEYGLP